MNSVCRTLQTTSTLRSPIEFRKRDVILDVNLTLLERPKGLYELSQKVSVLVGDNFWSLAYLSTWFLLNVIITLYCKALFSIHKFPYPILMTCIHMFFTTLGVFGCQWLRLFTPRPLPLDMRATVFWFSFVFTINIWLSNASLLAVSVNLHQVVRTAVPLFTMGISILVFQEHYPLSLLPPVLVVILGVVLTVWSDFELEPFGMFTVILGCFFSSLKGIITQQTQVGASGLSSLDLLRYLCPLAIIQLLILAAMMGEVQSLFNDYSSIMTAPLVVHLSLLGWIAFGLNFVSFRCAALLNPLTLNIAGNVKQVATCFLGLLFFGGALTIGLVAGILGTALGAYWYSRVISRWKSRQKVLLEENELDEYEKSTTASEGDGSSVDAKNEDRRVIAV